MTAVKTCPICHHAYDARFTSPHGNKVDQRDPKFKREVDGVGISVACQVPVRVSAPNNPGVSIGMPCGCTGVGAEMPELETEVLAPPPTCALPGCSEFCEPASSFCSAQHLAEMVAMVNRVSQ